ncbi:hypothetical protein AB5L52_20915 [Streptomyces sp. CG4]|uniref:hypothetical protein n=1 Tax=Streptomyces sp. CG4 TaxID=408783 RepID=UPI0034E2EB98
MAPPCRYAALPSGKVASHNLAQGEQVVFPAPLGKTLEAVSAFRAPLTAKDPGRDACWGGARACIQLL